MEVSNSRMVLIIECKVQNKYSDSIKTEYSGIEFKPTLTILLNSTTQPHHSQPHNILSLSLNPYHSSMATFQC